MAIVAMYIKMQIKLMKEKALVLTLKISLPSLNIYYFHPNSSLSLGVKTSRTGLEIHSGVYRE